MTRIWMLCLLTALVHSSAYAAKPNAEKSAKGKPAVEAEKNNKTDADRKPSGEEEQKDPPNAHHFGDEEKDPPERKK